MWTMWQADWGDVHGGDRVRQSRGRNNCAWAFPGDRIFGWSTTGGNRVLLIDSNANPSLTTWGEFKKHKKAPLAKRVKLSSPKRVR